MTVHHCLTTILTNVVTHIETGDAGINCNNFPPALIQKLLDRIALWLIQREEVFHMSFGNHQSVPRGQGVDVQERQRQIVFVDAVAGDGSIENAAED